MTQKPEVAITANLYSIAEQLIAIGKEGLLLNEIRKRINWTPAIIRAPPIQSKTVQEIRGYLRSMSDERKELLQKMGKKLSYRPCMPHENSSHQI